MFGKNNIIILIFLIVYSFLIVPISAQEESEINRVEVEQHGDFIVIDQDDKLLLENKLHNKSDFSIKLTKDQLKDLREQDEEISDLSFSKNRYNNNIPNLDQIKRALNRNQAPGYRSEIIEKSFTNVVVVSNIPSKPMAPLVNSNINHYYYHNNTNNNKITNNTFNSNYNNDSKETNKQKEIKTNGLKKQEIKSKLTDDEIAYYILEANDEFQKKNYREVIELLNFIQKSAPKNYEAQHKVFLMKGTIYYKLGLYNKARSYWYYSLKLNPHQPKLKYAMHKINKIIFGKK